MQKLKCPICNKVLIKNEDLVINNPVIFDMDKILETNKQVKTILCHNCKRKLKYYIESEVESEN